MKPEEWIRDPVFQLNLLIWMAKEQPSEGYCVRPFFHEHQFEWLAVEQPFQFPVELVKAIETVIQERGIKIHRHPEPELVLKRERDRSALYIEAKANSFSAASDTSDQARGHLLAAGPAFAETNRPLESALLIYVLPSAARAGLAECLGELRGQLLTANLQPGDHSVCGLAVEGSELIYQLDSSSQRRLGSQVEEVCVMGGLTDETDPSPLMLVYSDEDCPNQERIGHYRRVLQNQVVANLLCDLHRASIEQPTTISAAQILESTSQGVFSYLGSNRKKRMERLVRENVFRKIHSYWQEKTPDLIQLSGRVLTLDFKTEDRKASFLDWLENKKTNFDDSKPSGEEMDQMSLPL